jgi:hypothetical protein
VTIELSGNWGPTQYGGGIWVYLPRRMLRIWGSVDQGPPMSHWGLWRTGSYGLAGWNWRGGSRRWPVTLLAHTRSLE